MRRADVRRIAAASSGTSRCGITLVNQEPGPSTTQSASSIAVDRLGAGGWFRREQRHVDDSAGGGRDGHLAAHGRQRAVRLLDTGLDLERDGGHREHPAGGLQQAADPVEAVHRVVGRQLPQRHDQQVPDAVPGQVAGAGEPVLHHPAPGAPPLVVLAERRQRHPQVTGRQHTEVAPESSAGSPVVGDGDDGGHVRA